jgi:hypothetical protein
LGTTVMTRGSLGGFGSGPQGPVPPEQIRQLPTEGLALLLLDYLGCQGRNQLHLSNLMNAAYQGYVNQLITLAANSSQLGPGPKTSAMSAI